MARGALMEWLQGLGRAMLAVAAFLVVGVLATLVLLLLAGGGAIPETLPDARLGWRIVVQPLATTLGFLVATWLVGVVFLRRSWRDWGWRADRGLLRRILRGTAIGAVMAAGAVGVALAGGARLRVEPGLDTYLAAVAPLAVMLLGAALAEELVFRGLPLRRLADALGPGTASLVLAAAFAVAHLGNPAASVFGALNIALAAVWLAVAFFSPGGMALAWGLHFGWNATLALGFDAPVSGFMMRVPGPEYLPGPWAWLDGGAFGPEGGVVATLAMAAGTAYLLRGQRRGPAPAWLSA
jgi:membrane protease YdiL (CAAX protease family)